jgi:hypothetical protein
MPEKSSSLTPAGRSPSDREAHGARIGLWFFAAYLVLYGGFVALCAFAPSATSRTVLWGVNLAVLYGMGLIVAAVLLSLAYGQVRRQRRGGTDDGGGEA